MTETEQVAAAISAADAEWQDTPGTPITSWSETLARAAINALDAYRVEQKRKKCKHWNRIGNGVCSSVGSSSWTYWYCQDCGASFDSRALVSPAHQS